MMVMYSNEPIRSAEILYRNSLFSIYAVHDCYLRSYYKLRLVFANILITIIT